MMISRIGSYSALNRPSASRAESHTGGGALKADTKQKDREIAFKAHIETELVGEVAAKFAEAVKTTPGLSKTYEDFLATAKIEKLNQLLSLLPEGEKIKFGYDGKNWGAIAEGPTLEKLTCFLKGEGIAQNALNLRQLSQIQSDMKILGYREALKKNGLLESSLRITAVGSSTFAPY